MGRALTLDVPEEILETLERTARNRGETPEVTGVDWLAAVSSRIEDDPLDGLIGSLHTDFGDWGSRHDELIGAALAAELRGPVLLANPAAVC